MKRNKPFNLTTHAQESYFLLITAKIHVFPPRHPLPDFSLELDPKQHYETALTKDKEIPSNLSNMYLGHLLKGTSS